MINFIEGLWNTRPTEFHRDYRRQLTKKMRWRSLDIQRRDSGKVHINDHSTNHHVEGTNITGGRWPFPKYFRSTGDATTVFGVRVETVFRYEKNKRFSKKNETFPGLEKKGEDNMKRRVLLGQAFWKKISGTSSGQDSIEIFRLHKAWWNFTVLTIEIKAPMGT